MPPDHTHRDESLRGREDGSFDAACRFMKDLARATQTYGVSSHEMVEYLVGVSRAVGLTGEFATTPNYVVMSLWRGDESHRRVYAFAARTGNFNLAKLTRVTELVNDVEAGSVSLERAPQRLQEIDRGGAEYGSALNALAFVLCGAGFAAVLRVSWLDLLFGGLLSLVSFGVLAGAKRSRSIALAPDLLAATASAALAGLTTLAVPGVDPLAITVCAVVWFVPGFGLTIAPNELLFGNTLAGLTWFANAVLTGLKLFGGAALGFALVATQWQVRAPETAARIELAWSWVFVPLLVGGLSILFQVRARDLRWVLLGGWLVWAGVQFGNPFGFWQGTLLGAAVLNIFASFCYRRLGLPMSVVLLPGIMILVPGVASLRALYYALSQGAAAGLHAGSEVIVLVGAILGGLLIGGAILPAQRLRG